MEIAKKMAKGTEAKNFVIEKIKESFGNNYIGEVDKKIYVWSQENGQPLQIAISLTCPKNPVETVQMGDYDFNNPDTVIAQTAFEPAEITEEEKETVEAMMGDLVDFTQYNVFKLKRPHSSNSYYRLVWQVRRELLCNIFVEVRITSGGLIMSFDKADDCPDDLTRSFVNASRRDELIRDKIKSHLGVDSIEEVEYDIVSEVLGYYNNVPAVIYTLGVVDADGFAHVILFAIHRTQ